MNATSPEISVVVPTYQRGASLLPLLTALGAQTLGLERFEVVIVDNCSTDGTQGMLERWASELPYQPIVVRTPVNRGPAAARNLGWRTARAPLVAFLDDDCVPAPGWLQGGLTALHDQPEAGVIQGRTQPPEGTDLKGLTDWYIWRLIEGPSAHFEACNIFYRRVALEATGGFDEEIGWWGEDTAAGWRVLEVGWNQGFAPDALAIHPVERRGWGWFVRSGYLERNMVRVAAEHPGFRKAGFWRPWAYYRRDAAFVAAILGVLIGLRFRPALLLTFPYLWIRRPPIHDPNFVRLCLQIPIVDGARAAGHLRGAVANRIFVV